MTRRSYIAARSPRASNIALAPSVAKWGKRQIARAIRVPERDVLRALSCTVPMIPPSVNHYVKHSRGRHYRTKDADDFMLLVQQAVAQRRVRAASYEVRIAIYLGPKQRGDIDNFAKVVLDSLVKSGAIDSDSRVSTLHMEKYRAEVPSTFIEVRAR